MQQAPYRTERGRVAVWLDPYQEVYAREVAKGRQEHPRSGRLGYRTGVEGYDTHLMGVMAEIACCDYYGAEFEPVFDGHDDGVDFEWEGYTVQVKSTPYFHQGIRLFAMPSEMCSADIAMLCAVNTGAAHVQIAGWVPMKLLANQRVKEVWSNKAKGYIRCRYVDESVLRRPGKGVR